MSIGGGFFRVCDLFFVFIIVAVSAKCMCNINVTRISRNVDAEHLCHFLIGGWARGWLQIAKCNICNIFLIILIIFMFFRYIYVFS